MYKHKLFYFGLTTALILLVAIISTVLTAQQLAVVATP
ncbi:MAG: hypothetical protein ACI9NT_001763 [Bacteroidia bacterium]|jgi:hypothetical protein